MKTITAVTAIELPRGQYKNDQRHGRGTYSYANRNTYSGDWFEGNMTGEGLFIWMNGDRYETRYSAILSYHWSSRLLYRKLRSWWSVNIFRDDLKMARNMVGAECVLPPVKCKMGYGLVITLMVDNAHIDCAWTLFNLHRKTNFSCLSEKQTRKTSVSDVD